LKRPNFLSEYYFTLTYMPVMTETSPEWKFKHLILINLLKSN